MNVTNTNISPRSPLIHGEPISIIRCLQTSEIRDSWKRQFAIDISDEKLLMYPEVKLFEGGETGIRFYHPNDSDGSHAFYQAFHRHKLANFPKDYYKSPRWEHYEAISRLAPSDRILEIGSGGCGFLAACKESGLNAVGIEINQSAVDDARNEGYSVELSDVQKTALQFSGQFDVVCAFQVLEHIADPEPFIRSALSLLRPRGRLIIAVPNGDSFLKHQTNLLDMPPHHMLQWTERSLRSVAKLFGLEVSIVRQEPLAQVHATAYVEVKLKKFRRLIERMPWRLRNFINRSACFLISTGLVRKMITGQTIYVEFRK